MNRSSYVYTFASSLDGLVFYVGKGTGSRIKSHFWEALSGRESVSRVALRMREIWRQGGKIVIRKPYRRISELEALQIETKIIEQYGYAQLVNDSWAKHRHLIYRYTAITPSD